ncbi:uncharacterized protein LOC130544189 [Ursus arctos]|uniref:uncharacterized protein LOC130544189 n=1 Tax=Ursus arctos TaxID=9644 RepID=UPI002549A402|nr:uncharacterized protein LOC130544189 [Ursus arctos]
MASLPFQGRPAKAVKNGNVPAANAPLTAAPVPAPAMGLPEIPRNPQALFAGAEITLGGGWPGIEGKAWGEGDTLTSCTASAPADISPGPQWPTGPPDERGPGQPKQHALHPCPGASPARPGAKPGRAAWSQHPRERKNVVCRQKQSRMKEQQTEHDSWLDESSRSWEPAGRWSGTGRPPATRLQASDPMSPGLTELGEFKKSLQVGQPSTMCSLVWKLPQWCVRR